MTTSPEIHFLEWGAGPPVIALHGLGLDASSFTGLAHSVVGSGMRMIAADLPGFGRTPLPAGPLTAPTMARPIIELAASLEAKPLLLGMSMGARVALEAALLAPERFRGLVMMAPPLPRRNQRWLLQPVRLLSPAIAERIPLERAWPWLKRQADRLEDELTGEAQHDWFLRASKRMIYNVSCPATRRALISATRELALDPAYGPNGAWTRLEHLKLPTAFVWGEKDKFVDVANAPFTEQLVPTAFQIRVPCAGHFDNGPHFRCMEYGALEGIRLVEAVARGERRFPTERNRVRFVGCRVADGPTQANTTGRALAAV